MVDVQISVSSYNLAACERQLQLAINRISKWVDKNGFKFSPEKTVCIPFSLHRGLPLDSLLNLNSISISVMRGQNVLGIIRDRAIFCTSHLGVKTKVLTLLKHPESAVMYVLGVRPTVSLVAFTYLVRSRLDYGALVYGLTRPSVPNMLNPVHHLGLRLATGAFRTSPVLS